MQSTAAVLEAGSAAIPEAKHTVPASTRAEMDEAVVAVRARRDVWASRSVEERVALLGELLGSIDAHASRWVEAALEAKRIPRGTPAEGEEWLAGPMVTLRNVRLLRETLSDVARHGRPRLPSAPRLRANGKLAVPVFPASLYDKLLFSGISAEVWMQPGVTTGNFDEHVAVAYREEKPAGKVALVLGAGNVSSIGPMDALYKLFAENQVVVLKMNPVNEYLGPVFERALAPLVRDGFLRIVYGGAEEGAYLCNHDGVDEIHITGSDKTHDAIVFGTGPEGRKRKAERRPLNTKRITSELGNVSPVIVVPGPWSPGDLDFHGANLASMLTNNGGFNCNATRVIVQHRGWSQREALLEAVRAAFRSAPTRFAYYPGAEDRYRAFRSAHPEAEEIGTAGEGGLPWLLASGLDPSKPDDICFTTEAFCAVTSEVPLEAESPAAFVREAVRFANETLWGSLNAAILVHPKSLRDPEVARAVEEAIEDLRFGSVAVNHWPAIAYALVNTTWGAFPGHPVHDIRSGSGVVHNSYLLEKTEKSVVRGPFRMFPKPPWFVTNRNAHGIGERMTRFEAAPSPMKLPGIFAAALKG